jgi:glycerol uptake facilitator protein
VRRGFPWRKVPGYVLAQVVGAFVGAALVYTVYHNAIDSYEAAHHIVRGTQASTPTFSIFATFPAPYFHNWFGPFLDQVVGTGLLVAILFGVADARNMPAQVLAPFIVGLVVVGVGISFGANAGYAINPARDLGPRLLTFVEGWKSIAIRATTATCGGPIVGALIGATVYDLLIRDVLIARDVEPQPT